MDGLLLGETIAHKGLGSTTVDGFWMPAGGNDGVAGIEVYYVSATSTFTVTMQTKSSDATDVGGNVSSIGSVVVNSTTPGIVKFDVSNAKDLVRYRITSSNESDAYIHFQLSQPLWAPN